MAISDNLRGTLYMNLSMFAFTANDTIVKVVTSTVPLYETIALRGAVAVLGLLIMAAMTRSFTLAIQPRDRWLIGLRSLADVAATIFFLSALMRMPIANLSAVMQATPLAVTLGAALYFKDKVGWRRMAAIFIGFMGVMLIIRPGSDGFDFWAIMGLCAVAAVVVRDLAVRPLGNAVPSMMVALGAGVAVMLMGVIGAAFQGWNAISLREAALIGSAGIMLIIGYICAVTAMRVGDVGVVAPFRYTSLLWAIVLGWVAFGTLPDHYAMIGSGIVVATGLYTLLRERKLSRAKAAAA